MRTSVGGHVDDVVVLLGRRVFERCSNQAVIGAKETRPTEAEDRVARRQSGEPHLVPLRASISRVEQGSPGQLVHDEPPVTGRREGEGDRTCPRRCPKGVRHGPGKPTVTGPVDRTVECGPPVFSRPMAKLTRLFRKLTAVAH